MSKLTQIYIRCSRQFKEELQKIIGDNAMSKYVIEAVQEKAKRDGHQLPAAIAPKGVRSDAVLTGWRSRLYRDRYQLVASRQGSDWIFQHLHEADEIPADGVHVRGERPYPYEVMAERVVGASDEDIQRSIAQEITLSDWDDLWFADAPRN